MKLFRFVEFGDSFFKIFNASSTTCWLLRHTDHCFVIELVSLTWRLGVLLKTPETGVALRHEQAVTDCWVCSMQSASYERIMQMNGRLFPVSLTSHAVMLVSCRAHRNWTFDHSKVFKKMANRRFIIFARFRGWPESKTIIVFVVT